MSRPPFTLLPTLAHLPIVQDANSALDQMVGQLAGNALQADRQNPGSNIRQPWEAGGGFQPLPLDLSTLSADFAYAGSGYEVLYLAQGSTPGGILILNGNTPLFPGMRAKAFFNRLTVRRGLAADGALLTSIDTGTALLVIHKQDGQQLEEIPASADGTGVGSFSDPQAATEPAPTLITDGVSLASARGYRVTVAAASGQTLSGAGTLDAYYYQPTLGVWTRDSDLDLTIPAAASGKRGWTFPDIIVGVPIGRVFHACNGVTLSGGTPTLYYDLG